MLYAILCYHDEDFVGSWTPEHDATVMSKLMVIQDKLKQDDPPLVLDGPYAETKEQLLGFYIIDCENLDAAVDVARDLGAANPGGAYEIRPVGFFEAGAKAT
jgi:hypothetical protein